MLVQLHSLRCRVINGNSGWGMGCVNDILVQSPYPDPHLSDQRCIGIKELLHHGPRLVQPVAPVLLVPCLDQPTIKQCLSRVNL